MAGSVSTLGQSNAQISRLNVLIQQLETLGTQISSGKKTQEFRGLGEDGILSQRSRTQSFEAGGFIRNIDRGAVNIDLMRSGIDSFEALADDLATAINNTLVEGDIDLTSIRGIAESAYDLLYETLNTKNGDRYVFSGSEVSTQPIANNGYLVAAVQSEITTWQAGTNITSTFITNVEAFAESSYGYDASLASAGNVFIRADENIELEYATLANEQPFKDVLLAFSVLKELPDVDNAPGATDEQRQQNLAAVIEEMGSLLVNAVDRLQETSDLLDVTKGRALQQKEILLEEKNIYDSTVDRIENVDVTEAAARISQIRFQLEASFSITASIRELSLVNFI